MPRIPEFVPRVRPETPQSPGLAAPGVAPVRDATGQQMAALGEGLQAAGVAADRLGDWIDETQAQSVYNLFDEELSKIESSYGQLQGKDAMDAYQKTMESVGAARKKFEGSLQNERQRMMFASRAQVRQGDGEVRLGAWGAKQTKAAKVGSLEAGSAGSFRNYQNTLAFARSIPNEDARAEQEATARSWLDLGLRQREEAMRLLGSTDEQVAEMRMSTTSEVHAGVLDSLSQDSGAMQKYLDANRGEMLPAAVSRAERVLKESSDTQTAVDFHLRAIENAAKRGGTLAEQQAYADAIVTESYKGKRLTSDQYLRTKGLLKSHYAGQRDLAADRVLDARVKAQQVLSENLNMGVAALDPKLVTTLKDGGEWASIVRFANNDRYVNDPDGYNEIASWTEEQHRAVPDKEFLVRIQQVASPQGQARLSALRRRAIGSAAEKEAGSAFLKTDQKLKAIGMKALGLDKAGASLTKEAKDIMLDDWVWAAQKRYEGYLQREKKPDSEMARRAWLNEEEAITAIDSSGTPVSTFSLPVSEWSDPFVRFRGQVIRQSKLPVQITARLDGQGLTLDRSEVTDLFIAKYHHEPNPLELAAYMDVLIAGGGEPAQASQLVPTSEAVSTERAAAERKAFEDRVLRLGAGGKR